METKTKKISKVKIIVALAVVAVVVIFYLSGAKIFGSRFFPGTTVNGIDVTLKSVDEVKDLLHEQAAGYTLTILEREDKSEVINGSDIRLGITTEHDQPLTAALQGQDNWKWPLYLARYSNAVEMETPVGYDEAKLDKVIDGLHMMDQKSFKEPVNATYSEYVEGKPYEIVPEYIGTKTKMKMARRLIHEQLYDMPAEFDMEANDCYHNPTITAETPDLISVVEDMNSYINTEITVKIGKKKEVIGAKKVHKWIKVDDKHTTVSLDFTKVQEYVRKLKKKYDTIYTPRKFTTHDGRKIIVDQGDYGWQMDMDATANKIISKFDKFETKTIKPIWTQTAKSFNRKKDWGNTYIEIDLGSQIVYYVKKGKVVFESYCVSGNVSNGHATPSGIYEVTYTDTYQRMVGADYDVLAYYWIPFNGDIGLHDATWRGSFGGSQYYYSGSHGCVNMPYSKAAELWNLTSKGDPVICYYD